MEFYRFNTDTQLFCNFTVRLVPITAFKENKTGLLRKFIQRVAYNFLHFIREQLRRVT